MSWDQSGVPVLVSFFVMVWSPGVLSWGQSGVLTRVWCPPADCVDIVWAGYGTPWPGLDYHKEWGWLAAYKKDARQTRQHTLGHTRALILPVCVFLKGGRFKY